MSGTAAKWKRPHGNLFCTGNPQEAWNVTLDEFFTSSRKVEQESSSSSPGDHFIAEETKLREAKLIIVLVNDGMGFACRFFGLPQIHTFGTAPSPMLLRGFPGCCSEASMAERPSGLFC